LEGFKLSFYEQNTAENLECAKVKLCFIFSVKSVWHSVFVNVEDPMCFWEL